MKMVDKQRPTCSVAIATYNGALYVEKQINSIISQTRRVDEIVISDDGSSDETLEIARRLSHSPEAVGIRFVILTDNPRHGYCGNFEYAISHCTGDYIFISDQDDVWLNNKVERVIRIFEENSTLLLVFHDASLIDKDDNPVNGIFSSCTWPDGNLSQKKYLELAASTPVCRGMVMCISKELMNTILPFPKISRDHDHWILFCAFCKDSVYYLDEQLSLYRLHPTQTSGGSKARKMSISDKIKRIKNKINHYSNLKEDNSFYALGLAMKQKLIEFGLEKTDGYKTTEQICNIGLIVREAYSGNRFVGCHKMNKLYFTNNRYRKSGTSAHCYRLIGLLFRKRTHQ